MTKMDETPIRKAVMMADVLRRHPEHNFNQELCVIVIVPGLPRHGWAAFGRGEALLTSDDLAYIAADFVTWPAFFVAQISKLDRWITSLFRRRG